MQAIKKCKYICLALEPIHVGALDSSIAKDIDGLPYIPASSIKGCTRALASMDIGVLGCDGKGLDCPQPHKCSSCSVFGYSNYHLGKDSASLIRFTSAIVVFFPITTSDGLLWLSSPDRLYHSSIIDIKTRNKFQNSLKTDSSLFAIDIHKSQIDIFKHEGDYPTLEHKLIATNRFDTLNWRKPTNINSVLSNTIILNENQFIKLAHLCISSNYSVSLDPKSGSPKKGALFSVDSIKRSTVLTFEIIFTNPKVNGIFTLLNDKNSEKQVLESNIESLEFIVNSGLRRIEYFGIGGKRNRGYGRMDIQQLISEDVEKVGEDSLNIKVSDYSPKIFISYSHKNKSIARRLAGVLQSKGIDVWLDDHNIFVGDSIHRMVSDGLDNCDNVILLISNASLESDWVTDEINATLNREKLTKNKILLPTLHIPVKPATCSG